MQTLLFASFALALACAAGQHKTTALTALEADLLQVEAVAQDLESQDEEDAQDLATAKAQVLTLKQVTQKGSNFAATGAKDAMVGCSARLNGLSDEERKALFDFDSGKINADKVKETLKGAMQERGGLYQAAAVGSAGVPFQVPKQSALKAVFFDFDGTTEQSDALATVVNWPMELFEEGEDSNGHIKIFGGVSPANDGSPEAKAKNPKFRFPKTNLAGVTGCTKKDPCFQPQDSKCDFSIMKQNVNRELYEVFEAYGDKILGPGAEPTPANMGTVFRTVFFNQEDSHLMEQHGIETLWKNNAKNYTAFKSSVHKSDKEATQTDRWSLLKKTFKALKQANIDVYLMSASWAPIRGAVWAQYLYFITKARRFGLELHSTDSKPGDVYESVVVGNELHDGKVGFIQTPGSDFISGIVGVDDPGGSMAANKGDAIKEIMKHLSSTSGSALGPENTVHVDNSYKYVLQNINNGGGGVTVRTGYGVMASDIENILSAADCTHAGDTWRCA